MAYLTARGDGRFEIRESIRTDRGPRARSLATFRELTPTVIATARANARGPIDDDELRRLARRAGAPVAESAVDSSAAALYRELSRGARLRAPLARLIAAQLHSSDSPTAAERAAGEWLGRSAHERGRALIDLLGLADALPARRRDPDLHFPRLATPR